MDVFSPVQTGVHSGGRLFRTFTNEEVKEIKSQWPIAFYLIRLP